MRCCGIWIFSSLCICQPKRLPPVFLLPGIAGSGLFASWDSAFIPECYPTERSFAPYRLWATLAQLRPPASHQRCWAAAMSLLWSEDEGVYSDRPGITVSVDAPNSTKGFAYLNYVEGWGVYGTKYFEDFIQAFRVEGYVEGLNLFGMPYDWRLPPWQVDFDVLKELMEEAVILNGGQKLVVAAHSLGSVIFSLFLQTKVDIEWKEMHIDRFVSIAGAFGGSSKVMRALLSGYNDPLNFDFMDVVDFSLVPEDVLKELFINMGSIYALSASAALYGSDFPVVVLDPYSGLTGANRTDWQSITGTAPEVKAQLWSAVRKRWEEGDTSVVVHTLANWTDLLPQELAPRARHAEMMIKDWILKDPGVETICIWSTFDKAETELAYVYSSFLLSTPIKIYGFGDHTLPRESASVCSRWPSTRLSYELHGLDHMFMFTSQSFNSLASALTRVIFDPTTTFLMPQSNPDVSWGVVDPPDVSWGVVDPPDVSWGVDPPDVSWGDYPPEDKPSHYTS